MKIEIDLEDSSLVREAQMKVELLDHMGSDLDVVNAARVSFDKKSEWREGSCEEYGFQLTERDISLIDYLAEHHHWTPFSHCYAKFRIKAPLFVRSQLFKHKVGLTENEVSRRYVDSEPEFYVPEKWRKRADNVKQGSMEEAVETNAANKRDYELYIVNTVDFYKELLADGVAPEQARMVLPQSMMTEWIWSGSIAAFARVYKQRTSPHAQSETRTVAYAIGNELRDLFPISWKALTQ
jgi:thymidylate synthase (FAD)